MTRLPTLVGIYPAVPLAVTIDNLMIMPRISTLNDSTEKPAEPEIQLTFWQLMKSTLSAFIGIQSNANRERDFKHGKMTHFIWMGLLFGLIFVLTLVGVVQIVLHFSGN